MREMKDSGIEWIGKIPNNWRITRIKYVCNSRSEKAFFKHETDSYLGLENVVGFSDKIIETDTTYADGYYDTYKAGDVLFNKLRPYLGKVIIASTDGFCTGEFVKLFNYQGDRRYLRYWMIDEQFITEVDNSTYGAKMPRANPEFVLNMPIPVIPYIEQFAISNYLDTKCSEIDALTADIQSQIDTLEQYKHSVITEAVTKGLDKDVEMKESGIEYVGKIPASWDMHPVYYYFGERKHKNSLGEEQNLLSLSYGNIIRKDINTREGLLPESFNTYNIVEAGDIIIRPTDLQNDKSSLRTGLVREHGIITSAYIDLMPVRNINTDYYHYLLHAFDVMKVFYNMGNGVRQGLNFSEFSRLMVFEPSLAEQNSIVDYLNDKCGQINTVISEKQDQLATLDAYKKSTIYEYVTGKKEVPAV